MKKMTKKEGREARKLKTDFWGMCRHEGFFWACVALFVGTVYNSIDWVATLFFDVGDERDPSVETPKTAYIKSMRAKGLAKTYEEVTAELEARKNTPTLEERVEKLEQQLRES
ncbi:MAG: hypothetical protein RJP95_03510 [Pirellulales bacterium]